MSEMLKRVADFGTENSACGTADPKDAPASACGAADPAASGSLRNCLKKRALRGRSPKITAVCALWRRGISTAKCRRQSRAARTE